MGRIKPLRPTPTQIKRMTLQGVGSGVLFYNVDGKKINAFEFFMNTETGEFLCRKDDMSFEPVVFYLDSEQPVTYKVVRGK